MSFEANLFSIDGNMRTSIENKFNKETLKKQK